MKRVLIISPRFPPINSPDVHRVRQSVRYFKEFGWEPFVLTVDTSYLEENEDKMLALTVPDSIRVQRLSIIHYRYTRPFGFGDLAYRSFRAFQKWGKKNLKKGGFDLVYFSTTVFPLMYLGCKWKEQYNLPFVIDLQDPWLTDYYQLPTSPLPPGGTFKYSVSHKLAKWLEPKVMRDVDHIISVSPNYPEILKKRYAWLTDERFSVLPFGVDENDFETTIGSGIEQSIFTTSDELEHWVYVGAAGPIMEFSIRAFFEAVRSAKEKDPSRFKNLKIHFVGTNYAPEGRTKKCVEPIAISYGLGDTVTEHPERIAYFEALRCLLDADALLMFGSDDPGYTASKLFPYVLADKPLLAIYHEKSSVIQILNDTQAGVAIPFDPGKSRKRLAERIQKLWLESNNEKKLPTDWHAFRSYTALEMTRQQVQVFDAVIISNADNRQ